MAPAILRVAPGVVLLLLASGCARTPPAPAARRAAPAAGPSTKPDPLVVRVVGRQYDWSFGYPGGHVSKTLNIPAGRRVEFRVTSPDVIHSLFIPSLRAKCDAVPGRENRVHVTASREGPFDVVCSEHCGVRHSEHRTTGVVQSQEAFDRWLAAAPRK